MCNLTNKALAGYLFKMLASCLKNLENVNVGSYRLTAQFNLPNTSWHLYSARGS